MLAEPLQHLVAMVDPVIRTVVVCLLALFTVLDVVIVERAFPAATADDETARCVGVQIRSVGRCVEW